MSTMTTSNGNANYLDTLETYDDLSDIKVGDEVIIKVASTIHRRYVRRVVRSTTKKQFKTEYIGGGRWLKSNGKLVGGHSQTPPQALYFSEARWAEAERRMRMWQQSEAE